MQHQLSPYRDFSIKLLADLKVKQKRVNNNILGYDFYLGTSSDNLEKLGDKITQTNFEIQLEVNKSYFWQVVTFDQQGNNSTSGINQFQTQP